MKKIISFGSVSVLALGILVLGFSSVLAANINQLQSVSVGAQSGSLTYGTPGSVTYPITVTRVNTGGTSSAILSAPTLPFGATASFSPATVTFASADTVAS